MDNTIPQAQDIPRLTVLVHICYTLTGTLYPPPGTPPAGSKPRPAEKPRKPENNTQATTPAPEGPRGQTPSTESSMNSIRKTQINMHMLCKGSRLQPKAGSQWISTIAQQQDANNQLHLLLLTHEMWELPTPLITANKPSREIEVRELPAQPPRYTGTTRSSLNIASWYSQFNRTGIASKTGLDINMRNQNFEIGRPAAAVYGGPLISAPCTLAHAGRALAARLPRKERPRVAATGCDDEQHACRVVSGRLCACRVMSGRLCAAAVRKLLRDAGAGFGSGLSRAAREVFGPGAAPAAEMPQEPPQPQSMGTSAVPQQTPPRSTAEEIPLAVARGAAQEAGESLWQARYLSELCDPGGD
ncbi:hypothetical protein F511_15529 [Dorcoceras hygrometricum]|uniref:Uncharacterized protein n=1 Tax=Dorcoceras hygrometricum TaxID=472368 RepID=A0A2Z7ALS7_9LAMI|nr:hypothetical protein F511_15529 [Dorcoceras hygrometricum]